MRSVPAEASVNRNLLCLNKLHVRGGADAPRAHATANWTLFVGRNDLS